MKVFRIAHSQYIDDLQGTGARLYGGRWNRPGIPMLYTSQNLSLCILELLVHFNSKLAFNASYSYLELDIPDKHIHSVVDKINITTYHKINNKALWEFTEAEFEKTNAMAIIVPSFVLKQEANVIINPLHPHMKNVKIISKSPIQLDDRLAI